MTLDSDHSILCLVGVAPFQGLECIPTRSTSQASSRFPRGSNGSYKRAHRPSTQERWTQQPAHGGPPRLLEVMFDRTSRLLVPDIIFNPILGFKRRKML